MQWQIFRTRLDRTRDARRADDRRRSEAGDLRLPRRGRQHLRRRPRRRDRAGRRPSTWSVNFRSTPAVDRHLQRDLRPAGEKPVLLDGHRVPAPRQLRRRGERAGRTHASADAAHRRGGERGTAADARGAGAAGASRSPARSRRCSRAARCATAREIFVLTGRAANRRASPTRWRRAESRPCWRCRRACSRRTRRARSRDLLRAIADPRDPAKRLRAWLTPFFALSLAELPAAATGGDQPLIDRLLAWHAAAESGDLAQLFGRILDDSGLARRELFAGDGAAPADQLPAAVRAARRGGRARRAPARRRRAPSRRPGREAGDPRARRGEHPARRRRARRRADHDDAPGQGAGGGRRVRLRRLRPRPQRPGAQLRGRRAAAARRRPAAAAGDDRSRFGSTATARTSASTTSR